MLNLNEREIELIKLHAKGKKCDEISLHMRCSKDWIKRANAILKAKLNAVSIPQLICNAYEFGVLVPGWQLTDV